MNRLNLFLLSIFFLILFSGTLSAQKTYCNPVNVDYGYTPIPNFSEWGRHRATADPVIVNYRGDYYLFSTNQKGYWWSSDMLNWHFNQHSFLRPWNTGTYDDLCAPAVGIVGDTMIVMDHLYRIYHWRAQTRKTTVETAVDRFEIGGWTRLFSPTTMAVV
jgi:hypothetical protein